MKLLGLFFLSLSLALSGCGKKSSEVQTPVTLDELNQFVATMNIRSAGKPLETNQITMMLAAEGKSLPIPPAGKKLVFDSKTRQYEFLDQ